MSSFTFDTSGDVYIPDVIHELGSTRIRWDDLSLFAQGYVEALLRSMEPQPGQWFYMPSAGVRVGATFLRFGSTNGVENRKWALVHLDQGGKRLAGPTRLELTSKLTLRFSDLAPEALAMILRDCSDWLLEFGSKTAARAKNRTDMGREFWRISQEGKRRTFPPLRVYLNDDGKVCLAPATQDGGA